MSNDPDELARQTGELRTRLAGMAGRAEGCVVLALEGLETGLDGSDADAAILAAENDPSYVHIQNGVLAIIALHHPVGAQLRALTGLLHASLHLERMIELGVGMVRTVQRAGDARGDDDVVQQLLEMGAYSRQVAARAVEAFLEGDDVAEEVQRLDDAVDRLYAGIFDRLLRLAGDDRVRFDWATAMIHLTRQLERYADHAVDVAEQAASVQTGEPVRLRRAATS